MNGKLGAALMVLLTIAPAAQAADQPQVAVDQDGDAGFAWRISDSRNDQVQARRWLGDGLTDAEYLSAPGRKAFEPQVAMDQAGNATFVWTRFNGLHNVVQTRTLAEDGSLAAVQTVSEPGEAADSPQLAVDSTTGDVVFAWRGTANSGQTRTAETRTRSAGTLGQIQTLSHLPLVWQPQVGVDLNGTAVFAWRTRGIENEFIEARRRLPDGTLGPVVELSDPAQDATDPQLAVDWNGTGLFTWIRFNGQNWISQARVLPPGGSAGTVQNLSVVGNPARDPEVAVAPNVNALFAWSRLGSSGYYFVQVRAYGPAGWSNTTTLSATGASAVEPQVGLDVNGNAVVTWSRSNGTHTIIQSRRRSAGGTLSSAQDISPAGGNAVDGRIAMTGAGDSVIVWRRWNGSRWVIQARRRSDIGRLGPVEDLSR